LSPLFVQQNNQMYLFTVHGTCAKRAVMPRNCTEVFAEFEVKEEKGPSFRIGRSSRCWSAERGTRLAHYDEVGIGIA